MEAEKLPLRIRPATEEDVSFIFNSWLKSFRESGFLVHQIPNTVYFGNHHKVLQNLLRRCTVTVACNPSDVSQIYGYIVAEYVDNTFVLHWIYVKHPFRKLGVGKTLYNSFPHDGSPVCCTHLNKFGEKFLLKYNMIYHPYLAFYETIKAADANQQ